MWGCTADTHLGKIQRIPSLATRIITGNFDYIHSRVYILYAPLIYELLKRGGITFYVFLCLNVHMLSTELQIQFYLFLYLIVLLGMLISMVMTQGVAKIWIFSVPHVIKYNYKRSFNHMTDNLCDELPISAKEATTLD